MYKPCFRSALAGRFACLLRLHVGMLAQASAWARARWSHAGVVSVYQRGFHASRHASQGQDSLYLTGHRGGGSSAPVVVGLMSSLSRYVNNLGYFRPIAAPPRSETESLNKEALTQDPHVELVHSVFNLTDDKSAMTGVSFEKAIDYISSGREEDLLDQIMTAYHKYRTGKSFVVVEGTGLQNESVGFEVNSRIAQLLETPMLLALQHDEYKSTQDLISATLMTKRELEQRRVDLLGVLVNRVDRGSMHGLSRECSKVFSENGIPFAGVLPFDRILGSIRLNEVVSTLNAKLLYGKDVFSNDTEISQLLVATLQLPELLEFLIENVPVTPGSGPLVFTSADRLDLLTGLMYARESVNMPNVAGIVLTGGRRPPRFFDQILKGVPKQALSMPVFIVEADTFQTVTIANQVKGHMLPSSRKKIEWATAVWDDYIDDEVIRKALSKERATRLTPKLFLHKLVEAAKAARQHIVLPEGNDHRILAAACDLLRNDVCKLTILGNPEAIQLEAARLGLDLSKANIVNPAESPKLKEYSQLLFDLRKAKGVSIDQATDLAQDPNYFGTLMVQSGDADGMVSGAIHTTADTIRPALQIIKSRPDMPTVSSVFFMLLPDKVLVYGDCAINVNPSSEELAQIAVTSATTARAFGLEPRVAMLSYATGNSNTGPLIDKVRKGVELAKELAPNEMIEGPFQYDASVDPEVAKTKVKGETQVAGKANVLIFPDLNTGNNTYKAVQQSTGAIAMGPVLQGLRKPVNDLSRGCTIVDIYNTVVMTALQAVQMKHDRK